MACGEKQELCLHRKDARADSSSYTTGLANGLMLMDVGYDGLEWHVDEYSRKRAAKMLEATVQRRMAGAMVARGMQEAMAE